MRQQVEPLSLPSEFTQITNQREVSMALPGPVIASHQPGRGIVGVGSRVRTGRQAGEDQHGVVARGIELTPGFVGNAGAVEFAASLHRKWRGQGASTGGRRDSLMNLVDADPDGGLGVDVDDAGIAFQVARLGDGLAASG